MQNQERVLAVGENLVPYRTNGAQLEANERSRKSPVEYTENLTEEIIKQIRQGNSLINICRQDNMPDACTVLRWREAHPDFDEEYKRAVIGRARYRHEQAEQEITDLEHCEDKTKAYIADVRNRNRFRLMEIGSPHDYSTKLMMTHKHEGPILNLSLDLSSPQVINQAKTEIIEPNQSSFQSQTDLKENQNTKSEQIEIPVEKTEKA